MLSCASRLNGFAALDLGARWTLLTWGAGERVQGGARWPEEARRLLRPNRAETRLPYTGGLVGWIGYEAGAAVERMPPPRGASPLPALGLWRTEGGLCLDRRRGVWEMGGSEAFVTEARALLEQAAALPSPRPLRPGPAGWEARDREPTRLRYEAGVRAALAAIAAGDVYQINLAWEERGLPVADPLGVWLALRAANPARRGAFLRLDGATVLSNSPELYLRVRRRGDRLLARSAPIKGTADARAGARSAEALRESEKERAELTMIVDLVRNDLGRVAATGGVRAGPRRIVRCGDLWHAEQVVRARLRRGKDAIDAIAASFPPGSVTGAPKVEAMRLIGQLEPGPRGVYTGAIGFLADGGEAHLNVAIRTATVIDGLARFHVGAGLVADSDPAREWAETLAKGRALARWLAAGEPEDEQRG